jgi:hypothetical protein
MRLVSVRYVVPVFVTVDLDAEKPDEAATWYRDEAITRVFLSDEEVAVDARDDLDPVVTAEEADEEDQADPTTLTEEERQKALDIAENTVWPRWERP